MRMRSVSVLMGIGLAAVVGPGARAQQEDRKALEVIEGARKAVGGKKTGVVTSLIVEASAQRNVGTFQIASDLELLMDLPDKYVRSESSNGGPMTIANISGFNGDRPLKSSAAPGIAAGGAMIIRMGPGSGGPASAAETATPEQQEQIDRQLVRAARHEISRLMLGWFAAVHPAVPARYTYAGEAESPDGKAHVVDVTSADGFAARLFIDQKTALPLMVTYRGPQPRIVTSSGPHSAGRENSPSPRQLTDDERKQVQADARRQLDELQKQQPATVEYALYFDGWRDVEGIRFPHAFRRGMGGTTVEEWTIRKVKINPKIDPRKFAPAQ